MLISILNIKQNRYFDGDQYINIYAELLHGDVDSLCWYAALRVEIQIRFGAIIIDPFEVTARYSDVTIRASHYNGGFCAISVCVAKLHMFWWPDCVSIPYEIRNHPSW